MTYNPQRAGRLSTTFIGLVTLLALLNLASVSAQTYSLDWSTIDGGGGTSSGGQYTLSGTIGQPDAGSMTGGTFTLQGGFWPGIIVQSTGEAPTLFIQASGDSVIISWLPNTPGFALEETDNLTTPIWVDAPDGNPVTIPAASAARFYRLSKP